MQTDYPTQQLRGWSTMSVPADPHLSSVKRQICEANDYPGEGEHVGGNVGVHKLVQIVQQESALVWPDSGAAFEPIFQQRQWTWPRKNFGKDSPDKRCDVQPAEEPGESASEGHRKPPTK